MYSDLAVSVQGSVPLSFQLATSGRSSAVGILTRFWRVHGTWQVGLLVQCPRGTRVICRGSSIQERLKVAYCTYESTK